MTRYFLFKHLDHYPYGGFGDLVGIYDSEEAALAAIRQIGEEIDNIKLYSLDNDSDKPQLIWYQVYTWNAPLDVEDENIKVVRMSGDWNSVLMRPKEIQRGR